MAEVKFGKLMVWEFHGHYAARICRVSSEDYQNAEALYRLRKREAFGIVAEVKFRSYELEFHSPTLQPAIRKQSPTIVFNSRDIALALKVQSHRIFAKSSRNSFIMPSRSPTKHLGSDCVLARSIHRSRLVLALANGGIHVQPVAQHIVCRRPYRKLIIGHPCQISDASAPSPAGIRDITDSSADARIRRQQYHGLNMLMVYAPGANTKYRTYPDSNTLHEASPTKITHVNSLSSVTFCPSLIRTCNYALHSCSISWKGRFLPNTHHVPHLVASKKWLCRLHDSISSDDEYRSSRNIAISLFRRYRNVVDRGGGDNLKEFISAGVNAYALGCTDEGLRKELNDMKESGLKSSNAKLWRKHQWSSTPPVSDEVRLQWKGFCALIANAYYVRGMAWLPVKTLQLEQMAVVGRAEEPSVVASQCD
ncbi:hypothetical protein FNV43_RR05648 [Rhamnella rubrinervis]|uniref:DUF7876 domain-containing protein n=1 Tax=Rhamnella rubrinervis TaxID=2594499 RepID=A0A8K0HMI8_9ROSA|nr:hypothetical protein FNV43_RR05648 [Rhamnella rubrinervis]